jgi:hypothetical protein
MLWVPVVGAIFLWVSPPACSVRSLQRGHSKSSVRLTHATGPKALFTRVHLKGELLESFTRSTYSPHFKRKSLRGGVGSGAVRGESILVGGLNGCYWWKTV